MERARARAAAGPEQELGNRATMLSTHRGP